VPEEPTLISEGPLSQFVQTF